MELIREHVFHCEIPACSKSQYFRRVVLKLLPVPAEWCRAGPWDQAPRGLSQPICNLNTRIKSQGLALLPPDSGYQDQIPGLYTAPFQLQFWGPMLPPFSLCPWIRALPPQFSSIHQDWVHLIEHPYDWAPLDVPNLMCRLLAHGAFHRPMGSPPDDRAAGAWSAPQGVKKPCFRNQELGKELWPIYLATGKKNWFCLAAYSDIACSIKYNFEKVFQLHTFDLWF